MLGIAGKVWQHKDGRSVVNGVESILDKLEKQGARQRKLERLLQDTTKGLETLEGKAKDAATKKQIQNLRTEVTKSLSDIMSELGDDTV